MLIVSRWGMRGGWLPEPSQEASVVARCHGACPTRREFHRGIRCWGTMSGDRRYSRLAGHVLMLWSGRSCLGAGMLVPIGRIVGVGAGYRRVMPDRTGCHSYQIRTFGCQMNVHDTERLAGQLESAGYTPAATGAATGDA